jgi:hypothetical protein
MCCDLNAAIKLCDPPVGSTYRRIAFTHRAEPTRIAPAGTGAGLGGATGTVRW